MFRALYTPNCIIDKHLGNTRSHNCRVQVYKSKLSIERNLRSRSKAVPEYPAGTFFLNCAIAPNLDKSRGCVSVYGERIIRRIERNTTAGEVKGTWHHVGGASLRNPRSCLVHKWRLFSLQLCPGSALSKQVL